MKIFKAIYPGVHSTIMWTEFCHFLTTPPLRGQFLYPECGQKQTFFDTLSPPHLVHVVFECLQRKMEQFFKIGNCRAGHQKSDGCKQSSKADRKGGNLYIIHNYLLHKPIACNTLMARNNHHLIFHLLTTTS